MNSPETYITGCGMVTPLGMSYTATAAALRAGLAAFAEIPYRDQTGALVIGAKVPLENAPRLGSPERLTRLVVAAISECLADSGVTDAASIPLLLCVSESGFPGRSPDLDEWLLTAIEEQLGTRFHPKSGIIAHGRVAATSALALAPELLALDGVDGCLIAAVDSMLHPLTLDAYRDSRRLKIKTNPDGIIPGEAAAAVILSRLPRPEWPVVRVAGTGFGREPASIDSGEPMIGVGLAEAVKKALAAADFKMIDIDLRISDLTGERYGFKETNYALARVLRGRKETFELWHCMDAFGDTGAAAGTCMLARALAAFSKGYAPGKNVICQSSSESARRAAVVLSHLNMGAH